MTNPTDIAAELERLAEVATPGNLETAKRVRDDEGVECPACGGEGYLDARDYCNFDGVAVGVQFYGIGSEFGAHEDLWRAYRNHHAEIIAALRAAGEVGRMREALEEAAEYFDGCADAEYLPGKASPVPNKEMRLYEAIRALLDDGVKA